MAETLDEVLDCSDVVVIGNRDDEFRAILDRARPGQTVIDLVRIASADGLR